MNKIYAFSLFLGFFVLFCSGGDLPLFETLKGFEIQKAQIDQEVKDAKNDIDNLQKTNMELRKDFLDNKRNLQLDTFEFIDKENTKQLEVLKAEMANLDEQRVKIIEQIKVLMESDQEYKRLNEEANSQFEEIKKIRSSIPEANMHYTAVLSKQNEIDAKILKIKNEIELRKEESTGDNK